MEESYQERRAVANMSFSEKLKNQLMSAETTQVTDGNNP